MNDLGVVLRSRPPSRRARYLAVGLAVAGALLAAAELALRLAGFEYRAPVPIIYGAGGMHRFHPYWFWEPRPGTPVEGCAGERINAAGYRGPERPPGRRAGKLRIVTLGDSSTFGSRVCGDRNYPALLEQELPGSEVLNFGVAGFTAFQGAKLLAGRALAYRPDVVLAAFGATNEARPALGYDVDAKFAITSRTPPWAAAARDRLATLRLFQLVERGLRRTGPDRTEQEMLAEWGEALTKAARAGDYRANQSVASFERSLETIVELARAAGARVVLIIPPRRTTAEFGWLAGEGYTLAIWRVAARLAVPCWDVRAAFARVPDGDRVLFLDDVHPSVAGHRLYARFLADNLRRLLAPLAPNQPRPPR